MKETGRTQIRSYKRIGRPRLKWQEATTGSSTDIFIVDCIFDFNFESILPEHLPGTRSLRAIPPGIRFVKATPSRTHLITAKPPRTRRLTANPPRTHFLTEPFPEPIFSQHHSPNTRAAISNPSPNTHRSYRDPSRNTLSHSIIPRTHFFPHSPPSANTRRSYRDPSRNTLSHSIISRIAISFSTRPNGGDIQDIH